MHFNFR